MIQLTEVAKKIENMLNGNDDETSSLVRPNDLFFQVENVGYHIDHIYNNKTGKNFIPVYIDLLNGEYDPVSTTKIASYTISVTMYFPVRMKDSFFTMADFLYDCFVGKIRNYGTLTGKCLSNISPSEYGEIVDTDFTQYKQWVNDVYKEKIERNEKWMTMTFRLFLSTANKEFVFSNIIDYNLRFKAKVTEEVPNVEVSNVSDLYFRDEEKDKDTGYYTVAWTTDSNVSFFGKTIYTHNEEPNANEEFETEEGTIPEQDWIVAYHSTHTFLKQFDEKLCWTQGGSNVSNSPIAQQLIDTDSYAKNVVNITNYSKSIVAYFKTTEMWFKLLDLYNTNHFNEITDLELVKTYEFGANTTKTYTFNQVVLSLNENNALGDLISFTISFGDR